MPSPAILIRQPLAATPGTSRRCAARISVTLTTTGPVVDAPGPGIHGTITGVASSRAAMFGSSTAIASRLQLVYVTVQSGCISTDQFIGWFLARTTHPSEPLPACRARTTRSTTARHDPRRSTTGRCAPSADPRHGPRPRRGPQCRRRRLPTAHRRRISLRSPRIRHSCASRILGPPPRCGLPIS